MTSNPSTFQTIFFDENTKKTVRVPDYQRAFAWEKEQIDLFIRDLEKYKDRPNDYYFGHYIVENTGVDSKVDWDLVDGQQRITTFVLFMMICRLLSPADRSAFSLIERFSTVSYDNVNLEKIRHQLAGIAELSRQIDLKHDIPDKGIISEFLIESGTLTISLKKVVWALLRFHQAFEKDELHKSDVDAYINVVMNSNCSHHIAIDKSVAVNIFEMHNTRGIRLTIIEIVKAKLMQFVYDNGIDEKERKESVEAIQINFGKIFQMEELLAASTFRGELSLEHLLRLHLRVVDDGSKKDERDFLSPATNANIDEIVKYVDSKLNFTDSKNETRKSREMGVKYALEMGKEFEKSVRIVSEFLPAWDKDKDLVGDVLIFERDLSCQFFLLGCRRFETKIGHADGRLDYETLILWEKLLFTRDLHEEYHGLSYRDNFQSLFAEFLLEKDTVNAVIKKYLVDGFRPGHTTDLQGIVQKHLVANKDKILNLAFYWNKAKMIYAIYKYEKSIEAKIREVVKGTISVEHILPQNWYWIRKDPSGEFLLDEDAWKGFHQEIDACINGIGNLLLITPNENTSEGNQHPKNKKYERLCSGGTYEEHNKNRGQWEDPKEWKQIIEGRGNKIYDFMLNNLVGASYKVDESPSKSGRQPSE